MTARRLTLAFYACAAAIAFALGVALAARQYSGLALAAGWCAGCWAGYLTRMVDHG